MILLGRAVNAMRSNYNFTMLPNSPASFGSCNMKINNRKVEPPATARGQIARTYLYMESAYPNYTMSSQQRRLMMAWDKMYPVTPWECKRNQRIESIQQNINPIMIQRC